MSSGPAVMVALDAVTGEPRWSVERRGSEDTFFAAVGSDLVVGSRSGDNPRVEAYDIETRRAAVARPCRSAGSPTRRRTAGRPMSTRRPTAWSWSRASRRGAGDRPRRRDRRAPVDDRQARALPRRVRDARLHLEARRRAPAHAQRVRPSNGRRRRGRSPSPRRPGTRTFGSWIADEPTRSSSRAVP